MHVPYGDSYTLLITNKVPKRLELLLSDVPTHYTQQMGI